MLIAMSALALGFAACSGAENPAREATTLTETAANGATVETAAVDDGVNNFVENVALSDMLEIESARVALDRSKVKPVKDFAQMMIDAHTATMAELKPLASAALVTPPSGLDNDRMAKLGDLRNAKFEDFDDTCVDQQTDAHENALNLMKDFANNCNCAGLTALAAKTAIAVDAHLQEERALDKSPADDVTRAPS